VWRDDLDADLAVVARKTLMAAVNRAKRDTEDVTVLI
jgi:hypothetical protein